MSIDLPAMDVFSGDDTGLRAWSAVYETITISQHPLSKNPILVISKASVEVYRRELNPQEALHLSRLLARKALAIAAPAAAAAVAEGEGAAGAKPVEGAKPAVAVAEPDAAKSEKPAKGDTKKRRR